MDAKLVQTEEVKRLVKEHDEEVSSLNFMDIFSPQDMEEEVMFAELAETLGANFLLED